MTQRDPRVTAVSAMMCFNLGKCIACTLFPAEEIFFKTIASVRLGMQRVKWIQCTCSIRYFRTTHSKNSRACKFEASPALAPHILLL